MKILHVSFHCGCISDIQSVFEKLGHDVAHSYLKYKVPYTVTESIAHKMWMDNKSYFNTFDIIITTDTVALSYPFILHLNELKPHLIILNCNRFTYGMEHEHRFIRLLQDIQSDVSYLSKVTYIPYTDFERIWCGRFNIFLHERAIMPYGKYPKHINDAEDMKLSFQEKEKQYQHDQDANTIFIQRYHNHHVFTDLAKMLATNGISCVRGSYVDIKELTNYKAAVVLPDQFSKYFVFESIQSELVVFLPTTRFLMELVQQNGYYFNIEGSSGRLTPEFVNLCEWTKYPEARVLFDSFDDMINKIKTVTPEIIEQKKKWCRFYGSVIEKEHVLQWNNILEKIVLHKMLSS